MVDGDRKEDEKEEKKCAARHIHTLYVQTIKLLQNNHHSQQLVCVCVCCISLHICSDLVYVRQSGRCYFTWNLNARSFDACSSVCVCVLHVAFFSVVLFLIQRKSNNIKILCGAFFISYYSIPFGKYVPGYVRCLITIYSRIMRLNYMKSFESHGCALCSCNLMVLVVVTFDALTTLTQNKASL